MLNTGCPCRPYFSCSRVRPAQLNLKRAEKGGVIVKMKFLIALFIAPVFKWKEAKAYKRAYNHSQVWTILWTLKVSSSLKDYFGNAVSG